MSTTEKNPTDTASANGAGGDPTEADRVPAVSPHSKLRRKPILALVGLLLLALGGIGGAALFTSVGETQTVWAARNNVDRGQVITEGDLVKVQTSGDPYLNPLTPGEEGKVIGKRTTRDLTRGSLIPADVIQGDQIPSEGESLVGIQLKPSQMPAERLLPGNRVRLISTPRAGDALRSNDPNPYALQATVVEVRPIRDSPDSVVNLTVPTASAGQITSMAATERVALVVDDGTR